MMWSKKPMRVSSSTAVRSNAGQHARATSHGARGSRRDGREPQPRVERAARGLQLVAASLEIDRVVAVAPVRRAPPRGHEATLAEPAKVVRDQVLRFAEQLGQLPHGPIALHELA